MGNFLKMEIKSDNIGDKHVPKVALVGNPNCGKTTLFNTLTGSAQYVGNWPGVTVERKQGRLKNFNFPVDIVDLPGIYSLSPYSQEEIVTRNYIMQEKPDAVVNIVDSTNLERSLYLTIQLLELGCKVLLVLNMIDILKKKGKTIDVRKLEQKLGISAVVVSAGKNMGMDSLMEKIGKILKQKCNKNTRLRIYPRDIEKILCSIETQITKFSTQNGLNEIEFSRFNSIKFFEKDALTLSQIKLPEDIKLTLISQIDSMNFPPNTDSEMIIADRKYSYIRTICDECINSNSSFREPDCLTQKIDDIVLHKFWGIPIFLLLIFGIFFITFGPFGNFLKIKTEELISIGIASSVKDFLRVCEVAPWAESLVLDAVIRGMGSVISFLPQVLILFTLLSLLEDSGYMARAVFITDRLLRKIGLSGKAFVPMIMGFGCSVPAVMSTRILESQKSRAFTIFLIPFMSCSAKMPVYLLLSSAFFPHHTVLVVISLYLIGVVLAVITALFLKDSLFKGDCDPFIMELPEYKAPSPKNLRVHVWDRAKDFIERAGTVILSATIIIWFLQSFDCNFRYTDDSSVSLLSQFGGFIAPVFRICGFGEWRASVALLTGLIAKESIVSTMSVLYSSGMEMLSVSLNNAFSGLQAFSFMVFVALYNPCIAAICAMHKELKSTKLTVISIIYQFLVALFSSAFIYQFGMLATNFVHLWGR